MRSLLWFLLSLPLAEAAGTLPAPNYVYPSGTEAPLNTKILVHSTCCGSWSADSIVLRNGSQAITGRTDVSVQQGFWLVFTPEQPLQPRTTYTVTVTLPYNATIDSRFTTGSSSDTLPPAVASSTPSEKQDWAFPWQPLTMRFSKPMNPLSFGAGPELARLENPWDIFGYIRWTLTDAFTLQAQFTATLPPGTVYRIRFPGKLPEDMMGNPLAPAPDFIFTTYPEAPKDGPRLQVSVPAEGESGVATNAALFLVFDRPPMVPPEGVFSLVGEGDPVISVKAEAGPGVNSLILRAQAPLRGNQDYTLAVDKLYDQYGGQLSSAALLRFRTGALPETHAFQAVSSPPPSLPMVSTLRWRFSRRLNPYLLPSLSRVLTGASKVVERRDVRLLADGATIEVDVPGTGRYLLGPVYDVVECMLWAEGPVGGHIVTELRDTQAPAALAVFPSDGGTGVPATAQPAVLFDEVVDLDTSQVVLWQDDQRVAADVSVSETRFTIKPRQALAPGNYRAEARAPRDLAGNSAPDVIWNFRVEAQQAGEAFRVIRVEPLDGAQAVDPRTPLVVTFNRPPNQLSIAKTYTTSVYSVKDMLGGRWRFEENSAIFEPDPRLPPSARVAWELNVTDLAGAAVRGSGGFWTGAATDGAAFRVTAAVGHGVGIVALYFSEPALASTVSKENIAVMRDGAYEEVSVGYDPMQRRAFVTRNLFSRRYGGTVRVIAGAGIRSQSGAVLEPFSADVEVPPSGGYYIPPELTTTGPLIRSSVPWSHAALDPPDAPLVLFFSRPLDRARVEQGLRWVVGTAVVDGRIEWAPDSTALTFYPSSPLPDGTSGFLMLSKVPWSEAGVEVVQFNSPPPRPAAPPFRTSLIGPSPSLPTDGVIDVEFDADHPPDFVPSAHAAYGDELNWGKTVALEVSASSGQTFRLRPAQPLPIGYAFSIEIQTQEQPKQAAGFLRVAPYTTPASRQITAGPTEAMGPVPLNAVVWLQFQTPLNPLSLRAQLMLDDVAHRVTTEFLDAGFLVLLHPLGLLRGQATYTVQVTGLEDIAGRALPDCTWTFHTGDGPDLTPARLSSWSPAGAASPATAMRVTFEKPVYFRRPESSASDFIVVTPKARVSGSMQFSEDGRTLAWLPNRAWPPDTVIEPRVDRGIFFDWTNAPLEDLYDFDGRMIKPSFTTSAVAPAAPPRVEMFTPHRDATDAPLNVQIQARFAEAVSVTSLGGVRLETAGETVAARVSVADDGRTASIVPDGLLEPDRSYTVILEGVRNIDGVVQEGLERWSFQTGATVLSGTATAVASPSPIFSERLSIHVEIPHPVNPLSVSASEFVLFVRDARVAVDVEVDPNGRIILVKPVQALPANVPFSLDATRLLDWAGNVISVAVAGGG